MQKQGHEVIRRNPDNDPWYRDHIWSMRVNGGLWADYTHKRFLQLCPYGAVGDRLWVRETFALSPFKHDALVFKADFEAIDRVKTWKPSIHMPRWASRIKLEITGVRVERLNDISDDDVGKEGLEAFGGGDVDSSGNWRRLYFDPRPDHDNEGIFAKEAYKNLWGMIHGKDEWDKNPWVWVIEFERI